MSIQPVDHPLNLVAQDVFTYSSWILTAMLLALAVRMSRRERTPFYALIVLAAMVAAFGEPIYDNLMMLYFYTAHHGASAIQSHFTAFGVPQPVWTHSGYALLYAGPALYVTRKMHLGSLTKQGLYLVAAISLIESCAFEMIGINSGVYVYWGPHVLRILDYPIVIGMLEMAQIMCFAVAAAHLRRHVTHPAQLVGLFLLFPATFALANYGAGAALIVGLHAETNSGALRYFTTLISMAAALGLVRMAASFLPSTIDADRTTSDSPGVVGRSARKDLATLRLRRTSIPAEPDAPALGL
ncbi:MAG: hypothetical protein JWR83_1645 [Aeromicrobium sp.]|nr:hypothetical protein [Aeromicrobium sp.]